MIDLNFGDGAYTFALPLAQMNEIEKKLGEGLGAIYARVLQGSYIMPDGVEFTNHAEAAWKVGDLVEVMRQGLIGGGKGVVDGAEVKVTPHRANEMIQAYVLSRPLGEALTFVKAILGACIVGYEPKKAEPVAPAAPESPTPEKASSDQTDI